MAVNRIIEVTDSETSGKSMTFKDMTDGTVYVRAEDDASEETVVIKISEEDIQQIIDFLQGAVKD